MRIFEGINLDIVIGDKNFPLVVASKAKLKEYSGTAKEDPIQDRSSPLPYIAYAFVSVMPALDIGKFNREALQNTVSINDGLFNQDEMIDMV